MKIEYQNLSKNEKVAVFAAVALVLIFVIVPMFSITSNFVGLQEQSISITDNMEELIIRDLVIGDGKEAFVGDMLTVQYRGYLIDGTVFDSTFDKEPFSFVLGRGDVIDGWDEGLLGMREGGSRLLVVPPSYGYGEYQAGIIPANSILIFEVSLLSVKSN